MKGQQGTTLLEAMAVVALLSIGVGISSLYLGAAAAAPLDLGADMLEAYFRQARLKSVATTTAHRVVALNSSTMRTERAANCAAGAWTDAGIDLELPEQITMTDTAWSACFSPRGVSSDNVIVTLTHPELGTQQVEVMLGGTTRVLE